MNFFSQLMTVVQVPAGITITLVGAWFVAKWGYELLGAIIVLIVIAYLFYAVAKSTDEGKIHLSP